MNKNICSPNDDLGKTTNYIKEDFNLLEIEKGKTYIITKKEDYYIAMIQLSIIVFVIGMFIGSIIN